VFSHHVEQKQRRNSMAYATDKLEDAEKLIRNIVDNTHIGRALEICRWLLSFSEQEKHKIKCYQTFGKRPDIRFCIDSGFDCEKAKIMTGFVVIEANLEIGGLYSKKPKLFPYFKFDNLRRWRINSSDTAELTIEKIREHILESYLLKIEELRLKSAVNK
jgi:hypothetical protein